VKKGLIFHPLITQCKIKKLLHWVKEVDMFTIKQTIHVTLVTSLIKLKQLFH